jgi:hypothetical protein
MTTIRLKRGLSTAWTASNPILSAGEPGMEVDTGQMKVGDGSTPWNSLPYTGEGGIALDGHVNSLLPHPVYDDGPSLTLLYANAKV